MTMSDPIADMLTRIRNANTAKHDTVDVPSSKTTASILKLLKTLNEQLKLTIVIITHQMSVVKDICHRAAIMENGEVVECNDVYELFANPKTELGKKFIETSGSSENFLKRWIISSTLFSAMYFPSLGERK